MPDSSEAIRSYLSRGDLPDWVTVLNGDELLAFGEKISPESGEPLENGATAVKLDRSERGIAKFIFAVFILSLGMIVWYLLGDGIAIYVDNPHYGVTPGVLLSVISGIALYAILHTGFSDLWFILEKDRVRFRVRRGIRYRVESFPFASIEEVAIKIFPASPRKGLLARLAIVRDAGTVELFRGQVGDAESGGIAWAAGLLGVATGLPVTRRKFQRFLEPLHRRR